MPAPRFGVGLGRAGLYEPPERDDEVEDLKAQVAALQKKRRSGFLGTGIGPDVNIGGMTALKDLGGAVSGLAKLAIAPLPGGDPFGEVYSQAGKGLASGLAGMAPVILGGIGGAVGSIVPGAGTAAGAAAGAGIGALISKPIVSLYDEHVENALGEGFKPRSTWDTFGERGLLPGIIETASGAALGAGAARTGLATAGGAASKAGQMSVARRVAERAGYSADDIARSEAAGRGAVAAGQSARRAAREAGVGGRSGMTGPLAGMVRASRRAEGVADEIAGLDPTRLAKATERMNALERVSHPYQTIFHDVVRPATRAHQAKVMAASAATVAEKAEPDAPSPATAAAAAQADAVRGATPEPPMRTPSAAQGGLPLDAAMGTGRVPFRSATPEEFTEAITAARGERRWSDRQAKRTVGETVHQYTPEEYAGMRLTLSDDGKTGFAVKPDGEVVSVFNVHPSKRGVDAMAEAVSQGASKLDAFDEGGFLPKLYGKLGFEETGRMEWDPEYAPEGWRGGTPDVVEMQRTPFAGARIPGRASEAEGPPPARPLPGQGTLDEALEAQEAERLAATGKPPRRTVTEDEMERLRNTDIPAWAQRMAERTGRKGTARLDRLEGWFQAREYQRARRERMRFADADRSARLKRRDIPAASQLVNRLRQADPELTQQDAERLVYDHITKRVEAVSYFVEAARHGIDETHPMYHMISKKMGIESEIPKDFLDEDMTALVDEAVDWVRRDAADREAIMRGSRLGAEGLEQAHSTESILTASEQKAWKQLQDEYRVLTKTKNRADSEYHKASADLGRMNDELGGLSSKSAEVAARRRVVEGEVLDMARPRGLSAANIQRTFTTIINQVNEVGGALYDPHADRMMRAAKDGGQDSGYFVGGGTASGVNMTIEQWNQDAAGHLQRFADDQGLALQHRDARIRVSMSPDGQSVTLAVGQTDLTGVDGKARPMNRGQAAVLAQARGEQTINNLDGSDLDVNIDAESQWTAARHLKDLMRPGSQFNRFLRQSNDFYEAVKSRGMDITGKEHDLALQFYMRMANGATQNNPQKYRSLDYVYATAMEMENRVKFDPKRAPGGALFQLYLTDTFNPRQQLTPELWQEMKDYLGPEAEAAQDWYYRNHNSVAKRFGGTIYKRVDGVMTAVEEVPKRTVQLYDDAAGAWVEVDMDDLVFSLVAVTSVNTNPVDNMQYALQGALAYSDWLDEGAMDEIAGAIEEYSKAIAVDANAKKIGNEGTAAQTLLWKKLGARVSHMGTVRADVHEILRGRMVSEFTNDYLAHRWERTRENILPEQVWLDQAPEETRKAVGQARSALTRATKSGDQAKIEAAQSRLDELMQPMRETAEYWGENPTMEAGGSSLYAKIRSYYENLKDPMHSQGVTLDRVMQDLMGVRGQGYSGAEYVEAAAAIRDYADTLTEITGTRVQPHQVQAALWVYTKRVTNEQDLARLYGAGGNFMNAMEVLEPDELIDLLKAGEDPISEYFTQMVEAGRKMQGKDGTHAITPVEVTAAYPTPVERRSRSREALANMVDAWVHDWDNTSAQVRHNYAMSVQTGAGNAWVHNLRDLYRVMAESAPETVPVVRGLRGRPGGATQSWVDELQVGGTTRLSPASFSFDESTASTFSGLGSTPVFIHIEPGARGAKVQNLWDGRRYSELVQGEQEIILAGDFEVVDIQRPGGVDANRAVDLQSELERVQAERDAYQQELLAKGEDWVPTPEEEMVMNGKLTGFGGQITAILNEIRQTRQSPDFQPTRVFLRQIEVQPEPYSPSLIRTGSAGVMDLQRLADDDLRTETQYHFFQPKDIEEVEKHLADWVGKVGEQGAKGKKAQSTGRTRMVELLQDGTPESIAAAKEMIVSWIKTHEKRFTGSAANLEEVFDRTSGVSAEVVERARARGWDNPGPDVPLYQRMQDDVTKGLFYKNDKTGRLTMRFFETATPDTLFHEGGHLLRRLLPETDINTAYQTYLKSVGRQVGSPNSRKQVAKMVQGGVGDTGFEEWFADSLTRHMMGDNAPPGFEGVFNRIRESLAYLWNGLQGKGMQGIQPEMAELFNRWLTPDMSGEVANPRLRVDMAGQTARQIARAVGGQPGLSGDQQYRRGLDMGNRLAELDRLDEKAAKLQAQATRVDAARGKLQEILETGSLPAGEEFRRQLIRFQGKTERLADSLDMPSTNRVPPVWQPMWEGLQALWEEAKRNPQMAEVMEGMPETFPQMISYAAERGWQPEHIPLISQSKVQRLVFSPLGFANTQVKAGSRHARTYQDEVRDRSVAALAAAHVDVVLERENNALIDMVQNQIAQPLGDGQVIPSGWVEWDPATAFLRTQISEGVKRAVSPNAPKYMIPESVDKMIDKYSKNFEHSSVSLMRRVVNPWRALVLTWTPRWYVNNFIGNAILATVGGVRLTDWAAAWKEYRAGEATGRNRFTRRFGAGEQSLQGGATPLTEPGELAGVTGHGLMSDIMGDQAGIQTLSPMRGKNLWADMKQRYSDSRNMPEGRGRLGAANQSRYVAEHTMQRVNNVVDDIARTAVYLSAKRKGLSPERALRMSSENMVDYANLSPFERSIVRSIVPFYAWQKGILKQVAKFPIDHPAAAGMVMMLGRLNEEMNEGLPEMYRNIIDIPLIGQYNTRSLNPFVDAEALASPQGIARSMNPFLQVMARNALGAPATGYPEYQRIDEVGRVVPTTNPSEDMVEQLTGVPQASAVGGALGMESIGGRPVGENPIQRYLGIQTVSDERVEELKARLAKSEETLSKFDMGQIRREENRRKGIKPKEKGAAPKSGAPTFGVGR